MNRYTSDIQKCERGFTLVELIIVITIIGTLLAISGFSFNQWMVKNRVEAQVKQMVTDISELRIRAMTSKQRHSVAFNAASYVFKSYSTDNEALAAGTVLRTSPVRYGLKNASNAYYDGSYQYEIDSRGILVSNTATVFIDYKGTAARDCFTFHIIRVNAGKMNATGDTCNDK
jgi:prepilin-type N-terminal cleavage/methylation domain-containing protein